MAGKKIPIAEKDGTFMGYLATPIGGSGPGVIVVKKYLASIPGCGAFSIGSHRKIISLWRQIYFGKLVPAFELFQKALV